MSNKEFAIRIVIAFGSFGMIALGEHALAAAMLFTLVVTMD